MSRACSARRATSAEHGGVVAGLGEILVVVGRQHGDGEDAQARLARLDRGLHGLRIGMHGEERGAEPRHAFDALRDRVADVMKLEIDEHLLAGIGQRVGEGETAGEGELIADLVERHRVAEPRHHGLRRFDRRQVERDDQAVAGLHRHRSIPSTLSRHHARQLDQPARRRFEGGGKSFILQIVHVVKRLVGARHRNLLRDHQRAAAELQDLPQRHERTHAAAGAARRRADREHAAFEAA